MDYNVITPMAAPCGEKQTYGWGFDHFQSKVGKYLGVWTSLKTPWELYNKYGFNQLFIGDKQAALSAGFKADSLMGSINFSPSSVDQYGYVKYYHLDEPIENGATPENIRWIAQYIHDTKPNSLMMMSSYRSPFFEGPYLGYYIEQYLEGVLSQASNTRIMCDKYVGWFNEPIDQRPYWTEFRTAYQTKNIANWISLDKDHDDNQYSALIGHANNLGINNLWLYGYGSGNANYITEFCNAAWTNAWLRKFEQYFKIIWRCSLQNPCDCDPFDPEGWYIYQILPTGAYREIFP